MCNTKESFQKCHSCNSQDDPNCATLQQGLSEKVCHDYYDTCKVYVKPNMTTHRGCFKEMLDYVIECFPQSFNCKQCSDNNCNGEVFPANRLLCLHCEGSNMTGDCYKSIDDYQDLSYPCEIYNFRDSCYLYIDDDNIIQRGCLSDQKEFSERCQIDTEKCMTCQTSNCNFESVMKPPELSCIFCDSFYGSECSWGWTESTARQCSKERLFYEGETCYTVILSEDQVIRGCTLDGNVCRVFDNCDYCETDGCNGANLIQQSCYECFTDDDELCNLYPSRVNNVTCTGLIEYERRGCYTWVDGETKVKRGCFADFSTEQKMQCLSDEDNCNLQVVR